MLRSLFSPVVLRALPILCCCWLGQSAPAAEAPKKTFDVPAGDAAQTLKQFATQAGCQIVFPSEVVAAVKTNPVQGELTASDALDRMLHDTGLGATLEQKSGAYAVR